MKQSFLEQPSSPHRVSKKREAFFSSGAESTVSDITFANRQIFCKGFRIIISWIAYPGKLEISRITDIPLHSSE